MSVFGGIRARVLSVKCFIKSKDWINCWWRAAPPISSVYAYNLLLLIFGWVYFFQFPSIFIFFLICLKVFEYFLFIQLRFGKLTNFVRGLNGVEPKQTRIYGKVNINPFRFTRPRRRNNKNNLFTFISYVRYLYTIYKVYVCTKTWLYK